MSFFDDCSKRHDPPEPPEDELIEAELVEEGDEIPPEGKGCCAVKWGQPQ